LALTFNRRWKPAFPAFGIHSSWFTCTRLAAAKSAGCRRAPNGRVRINTWRQGRHMAQRKAEPKSNRSAPNDGGASRSASADEAGEISARGTVSGPRAKGAPADLPTFKAAGTEAVAGALPFNAAKPSEFGEDGAVAGQAVEPPDPIIGA